LGRKVKIHLKRKRLEEEKLVRNEQLRAREGKKNVFSEESQKALHKNQKGEEREKARTSRGVQT